MINLNLKKESGSPIYLQIVEQIKKLIDEEVLKPGEKIPSTREMSEKLQVNRSTICRAYDELWATGYIESYPGSFTFVRKRKIEGIKKDTADKKSILNWNEITDKNINSLYLENKDIEDNKYQTLPNGCIDMRLMSPDDRLFPVNEFRSCFNSIVIREENKLFNYSELRGYRPLREYLCERMRKNGIDCNVDEILITNGTQNSLELLCRLLLKPDSIAAVESPTYFNLFPLLKMHDTKIMEIPLGENERFQYNELRNKLNGTDRPAFFYTTPNFQNPTGITVSQEDRETLLSLCEEYEIPIIEDGFEEEMKYFGKTPLSIKAIDRKNLVIFMGSFSKILFPGLRVSWIVADKECIERLAFLKRYSDISSGNVVQAALYEFCSQGYFDIHIKRLNRIYKKRMTTLLNELKNNLTDENISWTKPLGGYTLMLEIKNTEKSIEEICEMFLDNGVAVIPGDMCYFTKNDKINFRLSIARLNEEEIIEGVKRLRKVLDIYKSNKTNAG